MSIITPIFLAKRKQDTRKTDWNNISLIKNRFQQSLHLLDNNHCTQIVWVCTVLTNFNFMEKGTPRGWGVGRGLTPRVPKVRCKGSFTPANFRAVCSVFLGPCKLLVEAISVFITYMRLIETAAWNRCIIEHAISGPHKGWWIVVNWWAKAIESLLDWKEKDKTRNSECFKKSGKHNHAFFQFFDDNNISFFSKLSLFFRSIFALD